MLANCQNNKFVKFKCRKKLVLYSTNIGRPAFCHPSGSLSVVFVSREKKKTIEDLQLSDVNGIILKLEALDMARNGQSSIYSKVFTYRLYAGLSKTLPCVPATSCKTQRPVTDCHVKPALVSTYAG